MWTKTLYFCEIKLKDILSQKIRIFSLPAAQYPSPWNNNMISVSLLTLHLISNIMTKFFPKGYLVTMPRDFEIFVTNNKNFISCKMWVHIIKLNILKHKSYTNNYLMSNFKLVTYNVRKKVYKKKIWILWNFGGWSQREIQVRWFI